MSKIVCKWKLPDRCGDVNCPNTPAQGAFDLVSVGHGAHLTLWLCRPCADALEQALNGEETA